MKIDERRRRFLAFFASSSLAGSLLPGVLWAQVQESGGEFVTLEMLKGALAIAGLNFSEDDQRTLLQSVNQNLTRYQEVRSLQIPNDVSPPFHFSPLVPGMTVNRSREPLRFSSVSVKRPANLEDAAFWPLTHLAHLLKSRQATSVELTQMYLARLHKHNATLNCVVTFLDDVALAQARQADAEIAAGKYKGPLHGIPWGAKDIIAVKGYKTTWGSNAYKDQVIDEDASVVTMLRNAGAVLLAKLTSGELAQGDRWFGGQTKNPWNPADGSSGSSAGPAAATAAGLVAFGIGSETSGSILSPSGRCGVTGLRPTFGRISRNGVMALSWTQDRLGPLCRYSEDCAVVMSAIAKPDGQDMSVTDIPFNWNAHLDIRKLRIGYLQDAFAETRDPVARANDTKTFEQLRALGLKLVPLKVPEWNLDVSAYGVESAAFFDELLRTGRDKQLTNPQRASGWKSSRTMFAVEYLQLQRARSMMMMKLAEATAGVDLYLAPALATQGVAAGRATPSPEAGRGPGRGDVVRAAGALGSARATQRHFTMANLACYPALAVPNGFYESGSPTTITIYGRPFLDSEILALGKAYQDVAGFHLKQPKFA